MSAATPAHQTAGADCPVCGAPSRFTYRWTPPYRLYACDSCGLLFARPVPDDRALREFYQGFLYRMPDRDRLAKRVAAKKHELARLFAGAVVPGRRFLDYGGGTGAASFAAAELGLDVTLYEIDRDAIDIVRALGEGNNIRACGDMAELEGESFDLILADNVIEHVREPRELVGDLAGRLAAGGLLVFKTPNARNTEMLFHPTISVGKYLRAVARFNGAGRGVRAAFFRPWTLDPPRHLYAFSAKSLTLLARQAGVDRSEIDYYRIPLWEYSISARLLRGPQSAAGAVKWILALPAALVEIATKLAEWLLRVTRVLSPGGLVIRIRRD